jgi:hypothetical protein
MVSRPIFTLKSGQRIPSIGIPSILYITESTPEQSWVDTMGYEGDAAGATATKPKTGQLRIVVQFCPK